VRRHSEQRRKSYCRATLHSAALTEGGLALPTWQHVLHHWQWRRTFLSRATVNDAAKNSYSSEIFSPMIYFLRLFQVWIIFV
jgi:hypothetical protein